MKKIVKLDSVILKKLVMEKIRRKNGLTLNEYSLKNLLEDRG